MASKSRHGSDSSLYDHCIHIPFGYLDVPLLSSSWCASLQHMCTSFMLKVCIFCSIHENRASENNYLFIESVNKPFEKFFSAKKLIWCLRLWCSYRDGHTSLLHRVKWHHIYGYYVNAFLSSKPNGKVVIVIATRPLSYPNPFAWYNVCIKLWKAKR